MDTTQFMGLLIGAFAILVSIASALVAIIITPVIRLNRSIQKLNDSIDQLNGANETLEKRVSEHGKQIDGLHDKVIHHDHEIEHLKEKFGK